MKMQSNNAGVPATSAHEISSKIAERSARVQRHPHPQCCVQPRPTPILTRGRASRLQAGLGAPPRTWAGCVETAFVSCDGQCVVSRSSPRDAYTTHGGVTASYSGKRQTGFVRGGYISHRPDSAMRFGADLVPATWRLDRASVRRARPQGACDGACIERLAQQMTARPPSSLMTHGNRQLRLRKRGEASTTGNLHAHQDLLVSVYSRSVLSASNASISTGISDASISTDRGCARGCAGASRACCHLHLHTCPCGRFSSVGRLRQCRYKLDGAPHVPNCTAIRSGRR